MSVHVARQIFHTAEREAAQRASLRCAVGAARASLPTNTQKAWGRARLREDCLGLALGAEVALEALAEARGVVADATAGAVAAKVVALAEEDVRAGGALLEGAVRAAGAEVADAADVLVGVPRGGVGLGGLVRELLLLDAAATVVAVARAQGALSRLAVVAVEALALAGLAVAGALVGALGGDVRDAVGGGGVGPRGGLGARALGAVVLRPGGVRVLRARVARALVVLAARAVAGAAVRAVGGDGDEADEEEGGAHHRGEKVTI